MNPVLLSPILAYEVVIGITVGAALLLLVTIIGIKNMYVRASADEAFVKTGLGGRSVVVDAGKIILPVLMTIKWISLRSMKLEVNRRGKEGLITKDRYRVDIGVEFYIKIQPNQEQILKASRSLGDRSTESEAVKELVEAKLVAALRSVAATMDLLELHQNRDTFSDSVQKALAEELEHNGLTLEGVSIVALDQTAKEALDPDNVFDAIGLKAITANTEAARKEKNDIVRRTELQIKDMDIKTAEQKLSLDQRLAFRTAEQKREVDTQRAEQEAETQRALIEREREVKETRIAQEQTISEREIDKNLRVKDAELQAQIKLIERQQEKEQRDITRQLAIEVAERDKEIGVIQKAKEQELEEAKKLEAVATREQAEQNVLLVEKQAEAERDRTVTVIKQRAESEKALLEKQYEADAVAYEVQKRAEAEAQAAELQAAAIERLAKANLEQAEAKAAGELKLIEAKNEIKRDVLIQEGVLALVEKPPEIIKETMRPAEKISDIKIMQLNGAGVGNGSEVQNGSGGLPGKVVDAFMQAGAAMPFFKEMLKFSGVDGDKPIAELVRQASEVVPGISELRGAIPESLRPAPPSVHPSKKSSKSRKK